MVLERPDATKVSLSTSLRPRVHAMVNVDNVVHWFRDASSDSRLNVLCRLLDCCMPLELHYLGTYLEELLARNMVLKQQSDATASQYSNLKDLHEITDSYSRRQLCVILTKMKSANKIPAYSIYDLLVQYDFTKFFSRVISMEDELVDEILLLFTLAANHPAMTFSQRRCLHQRLTELRETIEKSFKCCQIDVYSHNGQEYLCCSHETVNTTTTKNHDTKDVEVKNHEIKYPDPTCSSKTSAGRSVNETSDVKDEIMSNKEISDVHIKDLRVIKVQQRPSDKKYEYVFEVTWSNGRVIRIRRAYGELFDFQCKLRRRHAKEGSKVTGRRVIPYLPSRKPLKFCKGNDILPDITEYVREFAKLPPKLLHSEWVENFFSDGNERTVEEKPQQTSKSKQNSSHDKNINSTSKQTETLPEKSDKENVSPKKLSPKGKCTTSNFSKKSTCFSPTSGKLDPKKRNLISPKASSVETMSGKDGIKLKIANHSSDVCLKSPNSSTTDVLHSPGKKSRTTQKENTKESTTVRSEETKSSISTSTSAPLVSMTTSSTEKNFKAMNGQVSSVSSDIGTPNEKTEMNLDKMSVITSQTPLTVTVPMHSHICTSCSILDQSLSDDSLTSSMSASPLGSPVSSLPREPCRTPSLSSLPDQRHFDFAMPNVGPCSPETNNSMNLKLCQFRKYENLFKDFTNEQLLELRDSDIDKMELTEVEKQKLKDSINQLKSFRGIPGNGFIVGSNNFHFGVAQDGLLIVPNGYTNTAVDKLTKNDYSVATTNNGSVMNAKIKILDKNCNYVPQNEEVDCTVELNSSKMYEYKQKRYLHENSNGFCKSYCYNCGEYGHPGHCCFELEIEEPTVT